MEPSDSDLDAFDEDLDVLIEALKASFESSKASYHVDDLNDTLYIELEGLASYTDEEIQEIAGPLLEELDLDFEEIVLVPLAS